MPGNAAPSSRGIELQHHRHRHDQRHWPPSPGEHHGSGTNEQHRHDGEEVADTSGQAPRTVASATANAGARTTARRRPGGVEPVTLTAPITANAATVGAVSHARLAGQNPADGSSE